MVARFSAPVQTGPEAHPASCRMGTGSFPGVKRPGRDVDNPTPSSAEVKERVELFLLLAFVACSKLHLYLAQFSRNYAANKLRTVAQACRAATHRSTKRLLFIGFDVLCLAGVS